MRTLELDLNVSLISAGPTDFEKFKNHMGVLQIFRNFNVYMP